MAEANAEEKLIQWKMYQAVYWYKRGYLLRRDALAQFTYWSGLEPRVAGYLFQANMCLSLAELGAFQYRPNIDQSLFMPLGRGRKTVARRRRLLQKRQRALAESCGSADPQ